MRKETKKNVKYCNFFKNPLSYTNYHYWYTIQKSDAPNAYFCLINQKSKIKNGMNTSFLKRQSTWVGILLAGLVVIAICFISGVFRFNAENYLPLLKYSASKDTVTGYNLEFENVFHNGTPKGWILWGYPSSYKMQVDSVVKRSGKFALRVEPKDESRTRHFGCPVRSIPAIYAGKNITLKAFMRSEGVDQPIGLMLRIDDDWEVLEFDNMMEKGITGGDDWEEYSVTLPLPDRAKTIYIGAILFGKGKLWIDGFQLLIDDRDISFAKLKPEKIYLAEKDSEFDKGSKISIESYSQQTVTNLEWLGRIWGFLKYYHPAVATGDYNWDAELFRIMPTIVNVQNTDDRNEIFVEWIDRLGKLKPEKNKKKAVDTLEIKSLPDFTWMENPELGKTLSQKLKAVKDATRSAEHYYVGIGSLVFKNEKPYKDMKYYDDSGMRLLALFRYWNMIEYFFPNKYLMDKNWNTVLGEFIPVFLDGNKELDYKLALLQLAAHVNDTHASIKIMRVDDKLNQWKGLNFAFYKSKCYFSERIGEYFFRIKYEIWFVEGKAVVTGIPNNDMKQSSALKNGDIITHIDGKTVEEIVEEKKPYYPASNQAVQLRNIANDLLRTNYESISIQIIRNGIPQAYTIDCSDTRYLSNGNDTKVSHRLLSPDIGYIWTETLTSDSIPSIMEKFKDTKGIIIDFRCMTQDHFSIASILNSYLTSRTAEYMKFTKGSIEQPGMFTFTEPYKIENNDIKQRYNGKVVIIVNEQTQHYNEMQVMAFQTSPQVTVIGSTTAAAVGYGSNIMLPGNVQTVISGNGIYYHDGRETQRVGIALDMEVKPTIRGILEGRDELLEKAIEIIQD